MEIHTNDLYALKEVLKHVVLRDYDLIDERVAKILLEIVTDEYSKKDPVKIAEEFFSKTGVGE